MARKHLKDPNLTILPETSRAPVFGDPHGHGYHEVRDLFFGLLRSFAPAVEHRRKPSDDMVPVVPDVGEGYAIGMSHTFHLMTPEQRDAASKLYNAMGAALASAYGYGLDHGRDLLSQLSQGELKIGDFEQPHRKCIQCDRSLPTGVNWCSHCRTDNEDK